MSPFSEYLWGNGWFEAIIRKNSMYNQLDQATANSLALKRSCVRSKMLSPAIALSLPSHLRDLPHE